MGKSWCASFFFVRAALPVVVFAIISSTAMSLLGHALQKPLKGFRNDVKGLQTLKSSTLSPKSLNPEPSSLSLKSKAYAAQLPWRARLSPSTLVTQVGLAVPPQHSPGHGSIHNGPGTKPIPCNQYWPSNILPELLFGGLSRVWQPKAFQGFYLGSCYARTRPPEPPPTPGRVKRSHVSYSLSSLKGVEKGIIKGTTIMVIKRDTRSLDHGSCGPPSLEEARRCWL